MGLCSVKRNHLCDFGKGHYEKQFFKIIFDFGPVVQEGMSFKDISYLEIWQPLSGALAALLSSGAEPLVQFC